MNFEMHRVTFRSAEYHFCDAPIELWVYRGDPSPIAPWPCEAVAVSSQLDFNGHDLDLELDENFLLCAYEEEDGFWFALAVELFFLIAFKLPLKRQLFLYPL
ncbi:MAG: hypothetical protein H6577_27625 [Lewinellaceae bacterium]|nr:hypothetical protein [Saprospiraceae bacterium]MCB9341915.1 hypothetical protein [Lewinellaceae bacterium]